MLLNLEKGDTVAIIDDLGHTHTVTVLQVKPDPEHPTSFARFDYIDHQETSPMRRTAWPKQLLRIIKKNEIKSLDPKEQRPSDFRTAQKAVIVDGRTYVEKTPGDRQQIPLNPNVPAPVAVAESPKPVLSRTNKQETKKG
jgi:hypothetical protein